MADSLSLSLLLPFFFFFFISIAAQSNSSLFPTCPPYIPCNGVNISYPFWRIDDKTQFCGYPGFGINCSLNNGKDRPIIWIADEPYHVQKISYEPPAIILVDYEFSPNSPIRNNCSTLFHDIQLQSSPFEFTPFNRNLSFHMNCNGVPNFATEIPCMGFGRNKSFINLMGSEPENFDWVEYACKEKMVKTVLNRPGERPVLDFR